MGRDGEGDVRGGELDVGGKQEHVVDVEGGMGAVEVERHMAGGIGVVAVFGVKGSVFDGGERRDLYLLCDGFAGWGGVSLTHT